MVIQMDTFWHTVVKRPLIKVKALKVINLIKVCLHKVITVSNLRKKSHVTTIRKGHLLIRPKVRQHLKKINRENILLDNFEINPVISRNFY